MIIILFKGERCVSVRVVGFVNNVVRGVVVSFVIFYKLYMVVVIL